MRAGRHLFILITVLAMSAMACNLGGDVAPTAAPSPSAPTLTINPITAPLGSLITLTVAGFPTGARVNLLITPEGVTAPTPYAQDLTIPQGGTLQFAINIPPQIGTTLITKDTTLTLTVQTADGLSKANGVFLATVSSTVATANAGTRLPTPTQSAVTGGVTGGGQTSNFFITGPAIGSLHGGTQISVMGSGATYDNTVNVQIIDAANNVLANGVATIQSTAGTLGAWQTVINITQPATQSDAYIVAYTLNQSGNISQQASIPIILAGSGVVAPTAAATGSGLPAPTAIPIIITNTPWVITATPH